jgi:hypothetical protein
MLDTLDKLATTKTFWLLDKVLSIVAIVLFVQLNAAVQDLKTEIRIMQKENQIRLEYQQQKKGETDVKHIG